MTVSLIRSAESHTGTTGSVSQASFTFAVGQAADTPEGILVFVFQGVLNTDEVTSVTYGGQTVPAVTGGRAEDATTEKGSCETFFLGASVPSGVQSVVVNRSNTTTTMYAVAYLLGGAADLNVPITPYILSNNAAMAQQSIVAGSGTTQIFTGAYSGGVTVPTCANMTIGTGTYLLYSAYAFFSAYETTPTTGTRTRGLTCATDDLAYVIVTVGEAPVATTLTAASTLTGMVAGSASIAGPPADVALTAASTLTSVVFSGGGGGGVVTSDLVAEYVGKLAKTGTLPGNNTDPTETWDDLKGSYDGALSSGFAHTTASGFDGDGSEGNPYRLVFDCTDDWVEPTFWDQATDKVFSFEAWVRTGATLGAQYYQVMTEGQVSSTTGAQIGLRINTGGNFALVFYDDANVIVACSAPGTAAVNTTYHVVGTCDGSNAYLYINGSSVTGPTSVAALGAITLSNSCIGGRFRGSATASQLWRGDIATARVYDRALTAAEVLQNYNAGILAASTDASGGASLDHTPPAAKTLAAASTLTSMVAGSAALSCITPTTLAAASTLTAFAAASASLSWTAPPAKTLTAGSTLTGFAAGSASLSWTAAPAKTITAASTLTGFTAASASLSHTPPAARSLTAASTLTGFTAGSASITWSVAGSRSLTAASTLTAFVHAAAALSHTAPPAKTLTAASTFTAFVAASASLSVGAAAAKTLTAASTLTGFTAGSASLSWTAAPAKTLTGASTLTAFTSASASLANTPPAKTITGASTLTGHVSASASLAHTAPAARTLTAASTLSAVVSATASLRSYSGTMMTADSMLTVAVSSATFIRNSGLNGTATIGLASTGRTRGIAASGAINRGLTSAGRQREGR